MTDAIQFQAPATWRWIKISAFLLGAGIVALIGLGPLWALPFFTSGLLISFVGFIQSFRFAGAPVSFSVVLTLLQGFLTGLAILLYFLFVAPVVEMEPPALTENISALSGRLALKIPAGWTATPFTTAQEAGVLLKPSPHEKSILIQEVKVTLKRVESPLPHTEIPLTGEPVDLDTGEKATLTTFTTKKFWLTFHQVNVLGFKGQGILCSVSAATLPPHLKLAQDLCKAVFKNARVPATLIK